MKQLFIIPSTATTLGTGNISNISTLANGQLGVYDLNASGAAVTASAPTGNYAIAYGRGTDSPCVVIPEINKKNVVVTRNNIKVPNRSKFTVEIPTPESGNNYTIVIYKKGVGFHERNSWTATDFVPANKTMTAAELGISLAKQLAAIGTDSSGFTSDIIGTGALNIKVTYTTSSTDTKIVIEGLDFDQFVVAAADDLASTAVIDNTSENTSDSPTKVKFHVAYMKQLASMCAQNRGFDNTYADGVSIYPTYPIEVESKQYTIYTLRWATDRSYGSQVNTESVSQVLYIAVSVGSALITALDKVLL